jgi:hypothetical protein
MSRSIEIITPKKSSNGQPKDRKTAKPKQEFAFKMPKQEVEAPVKDYKNANSGDLQQCGYGAHCNKSVRFFLSQMALKDRDFCRTYTKGGVQITEATEEGNEFVNGAGMIIEYALRKARESKGKGTLGKVESENEKAFELLGSMLSFHKIKRYNYEEFVDKLCVRTHPRSLGFLTCKECGLLCQKAGSLYIFLDKCSKNTRPKESDLPEVVGGIRMPNVHGAKGSKSSESFKAPMLKIVPRGADDTPDKRRRDRINHLLQNEQKSGGDESDVDELGNSDDNSSDGYEGDSNDQGSDSNKEEETVTLKLTNV